jgi:hypothetical protein
MPRVLQVVLLALIVSAICLMIVVIAATPLRAQSFPSTPGGCIVQDRLEIRDAGEGRAIVTYHNSAEQCSSGANKVLTSPNGIAVRVIVTVNVDENAQKEGIVLIPQDPTFFSFPPEGELKDGDTQEFIIMGGMS